VRTSQLYARTKQAWFLRSKPLGLGCILECKFYAPSVGRRAHDSQSWCDQVPTFGGDECDYERFARSLTYGLSDEQRMMVQRRLEADG
jgi:hypothetical protein